MKWFRMGMKKYITHILLNILKDSEYFEKYIDERVTQSLKNVMEDDILKRAYQTSLTEIELEYKFDFDKLSFEYIIENFPIYEYHLAITKTTNSTDFFTFHEVSELLEFMKDYQLKYFLGFNLTIRYTHPEYGNLDRYNVFVNSMSKQVYNGREIQIIFSKIRELFKDSPELLI